MSANVRDIQAIREFRATLIRFAEEIEASLAIVQSNNFRVLEWLQHQAPQYWTMQTRKSQELVSQTRVALTACQNRTVAGHKSACIEEKLAYDRSRRRQEYCLERQTDVKKWFMKMNHEIDEYRGRVNGLRQILEVDIPKALSFLENLAAILEGYAGVSEKSNTPDGTVL